MSASRGANGNQGSKWCRRDLRMAVYLRDAMACMWCGSHLADGAQLTLDHLVPRSKGGTHDPDNLVTCCFKCNAVRADRPAEQFAWAAAAYLNHGVTADEILDAIAEHTAKPIKPFRDEAKAILARQPSWQAALGSVAEAA